MNDEYHHPSASWPRSSLNANEANSPSQCENPNLFRVFLNSGNGFEALRHRGFDDGVERYHFLKLDTSRSNRHGQRDVDNNLTYTPVPAITPTEATWHNMSTPSSPPLLAGEVPQNTRSRDKPSYPSITSPPKTTRPWHRQRQGGIAKEEPPKRVSSREVWRAAVEILIFQVPSLAITVSLLALYVRRFTWNPDANQFSALLFAARLHESLIVASLFHILYYHIRRALLLPSRRPSSLGDGGGGDGTGVPFGFLTAAFQLGSPFYMLSSSFWAPLLHTSGGCSLSSAVLKVLVVVTFVLAALAGASSGVVMLPRQGWYEFSLFDMDASIAHRKNATREVQINSEVGSVVHKVPFMELLVSPADSLYPLVVDGTGLSENCHFSELDNRTLFSCPVYNWVTRGTVAADWGETNPHLTTIMNISVGPNADFQDSERFGVGRQIVSYRDLRRSKVDLTNPGYSTAVATCPLSAVVEILSNEAMTWPGISSELAGVTDSSLKLSAKISDRTGRNLPVKQPRVVIQCAGELEPPASEPFKVPKDPPPTTVTPGPNGSMHWHFDEGFYPSFDLELENEALPWLPFGSPAGPHLGFIDTKRYLSSAANSTLEANNITVSAAFWKQGYRYMGSWNNYTVCLVDARWVDSDVWVIPMDSALTARHTVPVGSSSSSAASPRTHNPNHLSYLTSPGAPIDLALDWLSRLNSSIATNTYDSPDPGFVLDGLHRSSLSLKIDGLAILLADALSRVSLNPRRGWWLETNDYHGPGAMTGDYQLWEADHKFPPGPRNITISTGERQQFSDTSGSAGGGDDYARIQVAYYRQVWAYDFGTATTAVLLSWSVLLAHVLLILVHLIVVVVNGWWSSDAWDQLGELLALAINSTPPKRGILRNVGAGVDRWRTWRLQTAIREVDTGGSGDGDGGDGDLGRGSQVELVLREVGAVAGVRDGKDRSTTEADRRYG